MRERVTTYCSVSCASLIACFLVMTTTSAGAEDMKPGLWEVATKMGGNSEMEAQLAAARQKMQEQLASMPAAQRKQVEEMMARQGMSMEGAGNMTVKICVSESMASRKEPPTAQGNCKYDQMKKSQSAARFKFVCTDPPSRGDGEFTLHDPKSYSMRMQVTGETTGGVQQIAMETRGKWLSSDCGNIKPRD